MAESLIGTIIVEERQYLSGPIIRLQIITIKKIRPYQKVDTGIYPFFSSTYQLTDKLCFQASADNHRIDGTLKLDTAISKKTKDLTSIRFDP